jgi:hypothetical protein
MTPAQIEQRRMECEAAYMLSQPLHFRRAQLDRVQRNRGTEGRSKLEAEMLRQWEARKHAA